MSELALPELIVSRELRRGGDSTQHLERGARRGAFVRIRPGAYLPTAEWEGLDGRARHRVAMQAMVATARRPPTFSHESAAAIHGIPVVGPWPDIPRVVVPVDSGRRARVRVVIHRVALDGDVGMVDGIWATTPLRTGVDLAATRPLVSGVAALDDVLRRWGRDLRDEIARRISDDRAFRGVRKVRVALDLATGLAETSLESLSMVRFSELGFPPPSQQVEFVIDGRLYRVDFWWEEYGVIGEADGDVKYTSAPDPARVVIEEKLREDALRSVSRGFARWSWSDAWHGELLAARLIRAGLPRDPRSASRSAFST